MQRETGRTGLAAYLKKKVEDAGGEIYKVAFEGRRGFPDYLAAMPHWRAPRGRFIETKKPKGARITVLQKRTHTRLKKMGFRVYVAYTKAQVNAILAEK